MQSDPAKTNSIKRFRLLLVMSGLFNIVFAMPLILPGIAEAYLSLIGNINAFLGLGGESYERTINSAHAMLINTAGIDLVLIGAMMIYASYDPLQRRGIVLLNAIGRLIFSGVIIYYLTYQNLMHIVLVFGLIDILISIMFLKFLQITKRFVPRQA